jgi:hypothetical protein
MDEAQIGIVPTAGNPPMHSAQMAIDTVPHDFPDETADLLESFHPIELRHPKRGIIAMALVD